MAMTTHELLLAAQTAKAAMAAASGEKKAQALRLMAQCLVADTDAILAANRQDMDQARGHIPEVMMDRLALDAGRVKAMAEGVLQAAALPDPVGQVLRQVERPNGLIIRRISVPLGVVAIIYESRPNVTADAAALAVMSGNVCVLRSGREAWRSSDAIVRSLRAGLRQAGLPVRQRRPLYQPPGGRP